eukprot:11841204-Ditylum_brightwellii.AAC.1
MVLPEFDKTKKVDSITALVFDALYNYDIIMGRDFLNKAGLILDFQHGAIQWFYQEIAMKPFVQWNNKLITTGKYYCFMNEEADDDEEDSEYSSFVTEIKDTQYDSIPTDEVAQQHLHLTPLQ